VWDLLREQEAGGSNPLAPTILFNHFHAFSVDLLFTPSQPAVEPTNHHNFEVRTAWPWAALIKASSTSQV